MSSAYALGAGCEAQSCLHPYHPTTASICHVRDPCSPTARLPAVHDTYATLDSLPPLCFRLGHVPELKLPRLLHCAGPGKQLPALPADIWEAIVRAALRLEGGTVDAWTRLSLVSSEWQRALASTSLALIIGYKWYSPCQAGQQLSTQAHTAVVRSGPQHKSCPRSGASAVSLRGGLLNNCSQQLVLILHQLSATEVLGWPAQVVPWTCRSRRG